MKTPYIITLKSDYFATKNGQNNLTPFRNHFSSFGPMFVVKQKEIFYWFWFVGV